MAKENEVDHMPEFQHWSGIAILIWMAKELFTVRREVNKGRHLEQEIKSEVEKFLRPQIRFYVRDILQRRIKMKDTEEVTATIELDDAKGFPTGGSFDQPPVWSVDDDTICTLAPSADGLSCDISGGNPGNANVSVAGVAGGVSYVGSVAVPVSAGDATQVKVSLGTPVPQ